MYIAVSMGLLLLMWLQPNSTTWEVLQQGKRVKKLEEAMQIYAWLLCLWIHVFFFPVSTCHFLSKILLPAVLLTAHTKPFCHCCKAKWQSNTQQNLPLWCNHKISSGNNPPVCQKWQPVYSIMVSAKWQHVTRKPIHYAPLFWLLVQHSRVKNGEYYTFFWWMYVYFSYLVWPLTSILLQWLLPKGKNRPFNYVTTVNFLGTGFILLSPSHWYASCVAMGNSGMYALRTIECRCCQ